MVGRTLKAGTRKPAERETIGTLIDALLSLSAKEQADMKARLTELAHAERTARERTHALDTREAALDKREVTLARREREAERMAADADEMKRKIMKAMEA